MFLGWCYITSDSSALVDLMSDHSDMGTLGHELNVIRVRAQYPGADRARCSRLRSGTTAATPGGMRLGLTATEVSRMLGQPTRRVADSVVYEYLAKEYMKPGSPEYGLWDTPKNRKSCFDGDAPFATVSAKAIVIFRDERAVEYRLERYDQSAC